MIFVIKLKEPKGTSGKGPPVCCSVLPHLIWMTPTEMISQDIRFWGAEPHVFCELYLAGKHRDLPLSEDEAKTYIDRLNRSPGEYLMKKLNMGTSDLYKYYSDFIQHNWPARYMSLCGFTNYMTAIKFSQSAEMQNKASHYFRSFGFRGHAYLMFDELILGLAATDKKVPMDNLFGQLRAGYIYRFYKSKELFTAADLESLVRDSQTTSSKGSGLNQVTSPEAVLNEVKRIITETRMNPSKGIKEEELIKAIIEQKIRGTGQLFRSNFSVKDFSQFMYSLIDKNTVNLDQVLNRTQRGPKISCPRCQPKDFILALHSVKLNQDSYIVAADKLNVTEEVNRTPKPLQRASIMFFIQDNLANTMLGMIREFAAARNIFKGATRPGTKNRDYLRSNEKGRIEKYIFSLCEDVEKIFKREPRVLRIKSPAVVFGDIHGNLHDLLLYEKIFWKKGLSLESNNFLFLGDYVDRGKWSIEVVIYLFCMKLLAPNQFFLLRGNHEIRSVNRSFTFLAELKEKFGDTSGSNIYDKCNHVFDHIPVCALIDDAIFCSHGGIPHGVNGPVDMSSLANIPCPVSDVENQSEVVWEMLWNDPVTDEDFGQTLETTRAQSGSHNANDLYKSGFIMNSKRGTALFFSETAVKAFLELNKLSHVIRAHEVCASGFDIKHSGRTVTVFSSSRYGNGNNEAAVILVYNNKLRPTKIDTNA